MGKVKKIIPSAAAGMTVKQLRKELYKLHREARSRSYMFKKRGYGDTEIGQLSGQLKNVKKLRKKELIEQVSNISLILSHKESYVTNYKKKLDQRIQTLNDKGFDFVNKKNIREFGDFMDFVKNQHGKQSIDYDTLQDVFGYLEKRNISLAVIEDQFSKYLGSEKGLLDLKDALSKKKKVGKSASKIRDQMMKKGIL